MRSVELECVGEYGENLDSMFDCFIIDGDLYKDCSPRIVTGCKDRSLKIFHYETGKLEFKIDNDWFVYTMCLTDDRKYLIFCTHDGICYFLTIPGYKVTWECRVVRGETFQPIWRIMNLSGYHNTYACCYNPFTNPINGGIALMKFDLGLGCKREYLESHKSYVWAIYQLKTRKNMFVSGGGDNIRSDTCIRLWDLEHYLAKLRNREPEKEKGVTVFRGLGSHTDRLVAFTSLVTKRCDGSVSTSPNSKCEPWELQEHILSLSRDCTVKIWTLDGQCKRTVSKVERMEKFPQKTDDREETYIYSSQNATFVRRRKSSRVRMMDLYSVEGFYSVVKYSAETYFIGGEAGSLFVLRISLNGERFQLKKLRVLRNDDENETNEDGTTEILYPNYHTKKIYQMKWMDEQRKEFVSVGNDGKVYLFKVADVVREMHRWDIRERLTFLRDNYFINEAYGVKQATIKISNFVRKMEVQIPFPFMQNIGKSDS